MCRMNCEDKDSLCALFVNITCLTSDFIYNQLDVLYLKWVLSLLYPLVLIMVFFPIFIMVFLYFNALLAYIYKQRHRLYNALQEGIEQRDPRSSARYLISVLWDAHGYVWHGYEVCGMENIPNSGPALIIYYHGAIPIDVYYLMARVIIQRGRLIHSVGDRFLQRLPGWKSLLEIFHVIPGTVSSCVQLLNEGNILSIAPGGVREAQFSNHSYQLMWGSRVGFAKVALEANCPIIPMFTENLRESIRTLIWPSCLWIYLYEKTKLPLAPLYGGFPVKLRTHLGKAVIPYPDETPEALAERIQNSVKNLIEKNQYLPGNILRALINRFYYKPKEE